MGLRAGRKLHGHQEEQLLEENTQSQMSKIVWTIIVVYTSVFLYGCITLI
jgi:hypothetical protein